MQIKEYLEKSEKTLSLNFRYDEDGKEKQLFAILKEFIRIANCLDVIKKKKFYGRDLEDPIKIIKPELFEQVKFHKDNEGAEKILHAIIGIGTEAGELIETLGKHKFNGEELDAVNIEEELGDICWYLAILLRELNIDFHKMLQKNIDKLYARYGDKFSDEKANNRDLKTERDILEKNTPESQLKNQSEVQSESLGPPPTEAQQETQPENSPEIEPPQVEPETYGTKPPTENTDPNMPNLTIT